MISRRRFIGGVSAVAGSIGLRNVRAAAMSAAPNSASNADITEHVKIKIGTGGHGHTYPGATVPFGMVQLSPDTFDSGWKDSAWDHCSGYHINDKYINGFSHTHLSGTGVADLMDFLVMPRTGPVKTVVGGHDHPEDGYSSRYSHEDEIAVPGYYSVLLQNSDGESPIRAELSATERAGIHRYTFPKSDSSHFVLDLQHVGTDAADPVLWSSVKVTGTDSLVGGRSTNLWAPGREIYFAMKFSRPFASFEIVSEDRPLAQGTSEARSKSIKVVFHFPTTASETILLKTGISSVSADGAAKNLDAEIPGWDFDGVRAKAHKAWIHELSAIRIEGGSEKQKQIFYTGLYHALVAPTLFDDVDGQYRGMDGKVHTLGAGEHNYSTFSLWDIYRTANPLYILIQGKRVPSLVNCLTRMAEESPAGMPVWPLHGKETACMTGYHSVVVMAEAVAKGVPGIDVDRAWRVTRKRALEDDYQGLAAFRTKGYIAADKEPESTSKTLDYAYDAWAAAVLAEAAGAKADAVELRKQAGYYRNLYDKSTTFVRPRLDNGEWTTPFAANEMGHFQRWKDYTESNPWVTTFSVQQDPKGLAQLLGGWQALDAKLDGIFSASPELPPDAPPDIAGQVGQYAHGNEPGHHIAYLYNYAGAPYKTQARVASLMETMYDNQPDGLAGNEDCGQMSAWYIVSALGFYPVDPVSGNYVFGTPLFDRAVVNMGGGKELVVIAKRNSPKDIYIQSVTLNGKPHTRVWFKHSEIEQGATLVFTMGSTPNKSFGASEQEAPPSMTA
ncbi:MAG: GH92 family glycosyl hydrolase [Terracidiphilus sp.]